MNVDDILKLVPVDDIAEKFGVSPDVAKQAVEQGGAALLNGLAKNAESEEGSAAIEKALSRHEGFSGAKKVDDVDQTDGGKIVAHVFGDKEKEVVQTLTESKQTAGIDFGKLLPVLAPIIMGLIANGTKSKTPATEEAGGGGLGDILGGLLGGSSGNGSGGGGLGDILGGLGGLLGGGNNSGGGGLDIGGLLGGLLGGKK